MKRILIFDLQYYPFVGGAEVAIQEITHRIAPDAYEFHLVTARFDSTLPKEERIGNVLVHRIGIARPRPSMAALRRFPLHLNKYLYQLAASRAAERLHRIYRFDGIWAMMAHSSGIPAGIFKKRHPEVKYLLTLQEGDPPEYIERTMRPVARLFRQGFARADALQAISSFLLLWGKRMGFGGEGVVIPNGVDAARFGSVPHAGSAQGTALVTTSRLVPKNGLDTVIRALPLLPENVSFTIYGTGPEEKNLNALAKELRVSERVRFLGYIGHEELPAALSACDIFARPSRSEGMGNSFIEAMAAGLPVIATQEGGIADFLFDAKRDPDKEPTGWAVDTDSPEQIAAAVKDILAHPEAVRKVTAHARELALRDYDWNLIAGRMRALFDAVF